MKSEKSWNLNGKTTKKTKEKFQRIFSTNHCLKAWIFMSFLSESFLIFFQNEKNSNWSRNLISIQIKLKRSLHIRIKFPSFEVCSIQLEAFFLCLFCFCSVLVKAFHTHSNITVLVQDEVTLIAISYLHNNQAFVKAIIDVAGKCFSFSFFFHPLKVLFWLKNWIRLKLCPWKLRKLWCRFRNFCFMIWKAFRKDNKVKLQTSNRLMWLEKL